MSSSESEPDSNFDINSASYFDCYSESDFSSVFMNLLRMDYFAILPL